MEATTIGAIVEAITARFDAAAAYGEWPDRPHWQQPLAAPRKGMSLTAPTASSDVVHQLIGGDNPTPAGHRRKSGPIRPQQSGGHQGTTPQAPHGAP